MIGPIPPITNQSSITPCVLISPKRNLACSYEISHKKDLLTILMLVYPTELEIPWGRAGEKKKRIFKILLFLDSITSL